MKIGLGWYQERDYPAILEMMEDAHRLPATFASWLAKAEQSEAGFKKQGHAVIRAMIAPVEFSAWCQSRGMKADAEARKMFANTVAAGKAK